jgi:hypothetical protein
MRSKTWPGAIATLNEAQAKVQAAKGPSTTKEGLGADRDKLGTVFASSAFMSPSQCERAETTQDLTLSVVVHHFHLVFGDTVAETLAAVALSLLKRSFPL